MGSEDMVFVELLMTKTTSDLRRLSLVAPCVCACRVCKSVGFESELSLTT